ncbi:MAG: choice-of-anchor D domain-containing protein, partial [FCB group bacterium]|nr:choice-of-anchor D domain-containing protein [FCB group bacterium]
ANTGSGTLNMTNSPNYVTVNNAAFTVTAQPASSVSPGSTTTFTVTFDPTAAGAVTATVTVNNDDSNENPYTFQIGGTGTSAPEIDVKGSGISIPSGSTNPQGPDDTEFGNADIAAGSVPHTFTIANTGSGTLNMTNSPNYVTVNNAAFTVTAQPASSVSPGSTTTFTVTF